MLRVLYFSFVHPFSYAGIILFRFEEFSLSPANLSAKHLQRKNKYNQIIWNCQIKSENNAGRNKVKSFAVFEKLYHAEFAEKANYLCELCVNDFSRRVRRESQLSLRALREIIVSFYMRRER
ncbi:MAG: hypothetical protein HW421_3050 [Ignavibacteria bacterium]|nr:hypothetical protein [Ignavibacteria bacterium]